MHDLSPKAIIERVKAAEAQAKAHGLSMLKICADANVAHSSWQRWRNGEVSPRTANLYAVETEIERAIKATARPPTIAAE